MQAQWVSLSVLAVKMSRMPISVVLVLLSFLVMALAWWFRTNRKVHIGMMGSVMVFDLLFPIWLYMTHDWVKRLIDHGELFSFMIWTHLFLDLTLYALYVLQIQAGKQILAGDVDGRHNHRVQSKGILVVRVLVFISGAMLIAPE